MDLTFMALLTIFIIPLDIKEEMSVYEFPILADICQDMGKKMVDLSTTPEQEAFFICRTGSVLQEQEDTPAEHKIGI